MASDNDTKNKFDWQKGAVLDEKNSKPIGGVRLQGLHKKIGEGVLADSKERVKVRQEYLSNVQSEKYEKTVRERREPSDDESIIVIEESHSGITNDFEPSDAEKIFNPDADNAKQFQRISQRFAPKTPGSKK